MLSKLRKASEAVGHVGNAWTFVGFFGWQTKLTSFAAGMSAWAVTFFGSAGEGLSVTAVWIASLAAGVLVATIVLIVAIIVAVLRKPKDVPLQDGGLVPNAEIANYLPDVRVADSLATQRLFKPITYNRDVWLFDAICRMYLGSWTALPFHDHGPDLDAESQNVLHDLITKDIRQFAFEGRLPIWGKTAPLALWHQTNGDFWQSYGIDWLSFSYNDPKKLRATRYMLKDQSTVLSELMTSKTAVDELCTSDHFKSIITTNDANSLRIIIGGGKNFDHLEINQYGGHRRISVGVKNVGSKRITNCNFYRTYISLENNQQRVWLQGPFSLEPGDILYIGVVQFNEAKDMPNSNHLIGLSLPVGAAGIMNSRLISPRLPPTTRYTITFEATSTDSRDAVVHCELWVDDAGKLRLETI